MTNSKWLYYYISYNNKMSLYSSECKTLLQRLKECDMEEIQKNPSQLLKFYPIRDPDNEATVFDEVYCIVNDSLLSKFYRSRILYFLNTFLSSTKVPAYVVAAYIKRLARISLKAKPKTLTLIVKLIGNLFLRHPTLIFLRNRVDDKARELELESKVCTMRCWLENDPFDASQTKDLKATKAMDSCIWELMPLRFHRHPKVSQAASYLSKEHMLEMEFDLEDHVS